jgi:electron transport complex protein RnfG
MEGNGLRLKNRLRELKPVVVLLVVCLVAGGALALTHFFLEERITEVEQAEINRALSEIFPSATSFDKEDGYYEALEDESVIGYAAIAEGPGYGATLGGCDIKLVFGIEPDNKTIVGVRIIIHSETPGLGARITENWFLEQFKGKSLGNLTLKKDNVGEIDAITGATISSETVVKIVRKELEEIVGLLPEG